MKMFETIERILAALPVVRLSFKLNFLGEAHLPWYKGSTFRGAFGNALKRVICANPRLVRNDACQQCLLVSSCLYKKIFEPAPAILWGWQENEKAIPPPPPYIFEPPLTGQKDFSAGEQMEVGMTLIGEATRQLPYVIYAFVKMGEIGIGKHRWDNKGSLTGKFAVKQVENGHLLYDGQSFFNTSCQKENFLARAKGSNPKTLTINFLTPTRLSSYRQLLGPRELQFFHLVEWLLRRLNILCRVYGAGEGVSREVWENLSELGKEVKRGESALFWQDWERFSHRQNRRMFLGGIMGKVSFQGDLKPFLPLIAAGEVLHLGKQSSFGLGQYEILS
jgi:hypothetical protein